MKKSLFQKSKVKLFLCFLLVSYVLCAGLVLSIKTNRMNIFSGHTQIEESNWYFGEKGGELKPVNLFDRQRFEQDKTYVLTTKLSYDGEGDIFPSAFLRVINYEIKVFIDGRHIFSYPDENMNGRALGYVSYAAPVGHDCEGRELTLEIKSSTKDVAMRRLPMIVFGDYSTSMYNLFLESLPNTLISIIILIISVMLIFVGNFDDERIWENIHFAGFTILLAIYGLTQNHFLLHYIANPYSIYLWEYFALAASPIPFILSYKCRLAPYYAKQFNALVVIDTVNLIIQIILFFGNVLNMESLLIYTHICIFISAISVCVCSFRVSRIKNEPQLFWQILPFLTGMVFDIILYYLFIKLHTSKIFISLGLCIGTGTIITLAMLVWEARRDGRKIYSESLKSQLHAEMAYKDVLTGMNNRAAFEAEIEKIKSGRRTYKKLFVVVSDLNGLKSVNDSLGHQTGDVMIKKAAQLQQKHFGKSGRVYRIGGDEFCSLLYDVDEKQFNDMKESIEKECKKITFEQNEELSISMGCASVIERDVEQAIKLADERMYLDKNGTLA